MAIPDFDDLPKVEGMPQGCAWGVFDTDGKKDLLGTLNLLTPDIVAAAATEVKDGVSISLKYAETSGTALFIGFHIDDALQLASQRHQDPLAWPEVSCPQDHVPLIQRTHATRFPRLGR